MMNLYFNDQIHECDWYQYIYWYWYTVSVSILGKFIFIGMSLPALIIIGKNHQTFICFQSPFQIEDPTQLQLVWVGIDFVFPKEGRKKNPHLAFSRFWTLVTVLWVSGRCLEIVWRVCGWCLVAVWKVSYMCLEGGGF